MNMDEHIKEMREATKHTRAVFGAEKLKAVPIFEDILCYPRDEVAELAKLAFSIQDEKDEGLQAEMIKKFVVIRDSLKPTANSPEKIYLWPKGNIPTETNYTDNSDYYYNHQPDFEPYMYEMLIPEGITPKGAVVVCAGGDHGECVPYEGYQSCLDLNAMGYQCFLLLNRPNHNPWSAKEAGADAARAIRIIRRDHRKYRIEKSNIAFAGFSNGGVTGEACIQYYSGKQSVAEHFAAYKPDELDDYYGAPDAFLCVYGPRFAGEPFNYDVAEYPPVFFAVGRNDGALDNLNYVYPQLIEQGIKAEIHTFAGTPHGVAGKCLFDGEVKYPNFNLWLPLADAFMQDAYNNK